MPRTVAALLALFAATAARADLFDQFTRTDLDKALATPALVEVQQYATEDAAKQPPLVPGTTAALLVVRTNDGRLAKLLVQPARQKFGETQVPIALVERYTTYRDGQERAVHASGTNVQLYGGLHLHLDLGQVVPASPGGDLQLVVDGTGPRAKATLKPVGKAKLYVAKTLPAATPPAKSAKVTVGEQWEAAYFNGVYKLHDDGRRFGVLTLEVDASNEVTGTFVSDKDGQKYEVAGKVGPARHAIAFTVRYPRVEQPFTGFLFTGDARAIAGTTKLQEREVAFYATRVED